MHVFLDVHVASNDQQSAVACSIASSHEDLHEVTSISSCADLNTPSVVSSTVSQGMDLCLEFSDQQPRFILINKFFQQILIDGLRTVPSTNFEYGQIHHNLRINFGIRHEVLNQFFIHHFVLNLFFIHHDLRINFLIHHDLLITSSNFSPRGR